MTAPCAEFPNDNTALHAGAVWVNEHVTGIAKAEVAAAAVAVEVEAEPAVEVEVEAEPEVAVAVEAEPEVAVEVEVEVEAEPEVAVAVAVEPAVEVEVEVAAAAAVVPVPGPTLEEATDGDEDDEAPVIVDDLDGSFIDEGPVANDDTDEPLVVEEMEPFEVVCEGAAVEAACGTAAEAPTPLDSAPPPPERDPFLVLVCALADVAIADGATEAAELLPRLLGEGDIDGPLSEEARAALEAGAVIRDGAVTPEFARAAAAWRAILRGESEDFDACGASMLDEWSADLLARVLGDAARAGDLRREVRARGVAAFGLIEAFA